MVEIEVDGKPVGGHSSLAGCPGHWIHNSSVMGADALPRPCFDEDCQEEFDEWPEWLKRQSEDVTEFSHRSPEA